MGTLITVLFIGWAILVVGAVLEAFFGEDDE